MIQIYRQFTLLYSDGTQHAFRSALTDLHPSDRAALSGSSEEFPEMTCRCQDGSDSDSDRQPHTHTNSHVTGHCGFFLHL